MEYISIDEFAKKWDLGRSKVNQLLSSEDIPGAVKIGKQWRIPENAIPGSSTGQGSKKLLKQEQRLAEKRLTADELELDERIAKARGNFNEIEEVRTAKAKLDKREKELQTWTEQLEGREKQVENRQGLIDAQEEAVKEREKSISGKQGALTKRENEIAERLEQLEKNESAYKEKAEILKSEKAAFKEAKETHEQEIKAIRRKIEQNAVEAAAALKYLLEIKAQYELNHDEKKVISWLNSVLETGIPIPGQKKNKR